MASIDDAARAERLVREVLRPEMLRELTGRHLPSLFDTIFVAMVQLVHGLIAVQNRTGEISANHSRVLERAEEARVSSQRVEDELSQRLSDVQAQAADWEARYQSTCDERDAWRSRYQEAEWEVAALAKRLQDEEGRISTLEEEKAVALERAEEAERRSALALASEEKAKARAEEAEATADRANKRAQEAEARAEGAVASFKESPEFAQEVAEGSLDAYGQGFEACKARVIEVLKISPAELGDIQAGDDDEEVDEAAAGPGSGEP